MKSVAIIPAFEDGLRLSDVVRAARQYVDHVVVVDDGSAQPLRAFIAPQSNVTVVRHAINLGKGAALKTGSLYARRHGFDLVVFLDADGQHDPHEIPLLLAPLHTTSAAIVFGVRKFHRRMPLVARLGNVFLTNAIRLFFRIRVSDTQSGFRALRLSVYPAIEWDSARYAVETEMIVNAGRRRLAFTEVPISTIYHAKYHGTTIVDGIRIFLNIISWKLL